MKTHEETSGFTGRRLAPPSMGGFGRWLTMTAGAALLIIVFTFSLLALGVLLIGGALVFAWLKWKTRHLRQPLREAMAQQATRQPEPDGRVIEGEVIGAAEYEARPPAPPSASSMTGRP